ncbi:Alpha/Beta hydrolase protein [Mycena galopus ATCC 62051]|nr:Alpha/Beta hydrolase protein [Mycena galopus ATCC 62051]
MLSARDVIFTATFTVAFASATATNTFHLQPFKIDLSDKIPRLESLVNNTRLPAQALYPDPSYKQPSAEYGNESNVFSQLRADWSSNFNREAQQAELNQFTAVIVGQTVHFIHEKSKDSDALPVILLHGWPGDFPWENNAEEKSCFVFSSAPPANWTVDDTARGAAVGYSLYSSFNTTVRASQFVFLLFFPPSAEEIAENNVTLSAVQTVTEERYTEWTSSGTGYFVGRATKPNDFGLVLYDNPVGQLAWIGSKFKLSILTSVSLYYLTESFLSSVWIYAQNPDGFKSVYMKASTDTPLLFSQYEYNVGLWPEEYIAQVGNLVSYKGHFAGLHNPPALIQDIREMGLWF